MMCTTSSDLVDFWKVAVLRFVVPAVLSHCIPCSTAALHCILRMQAHQEKLSHDAHHTDCLCSSHKTVSPPTRPAGQQPFL